MKGERSPLTLLEVSASPRRATRPKNQAPSRHRRARPCDASCRSLLTLGQHGGSSTRHGHGPKPVRPSGLDPSPQSPGKPPGNTKRDPRETPSQSRETPQTATTPGLQSSSTQLRVLHTTAQKIKQLTPLPLDGFKVVFRSQGGLPLTTLQPRYLLTALMQAAALTDPSTLTLRIHPVNNTCTVSAVKEKDALKLVQLQHITYDKHEYAMTAYIAPPDGSVRGVITNAYWKESPQELLADLISRNPHETMLDA
ncbi:hypothetical protein HPB51_020678 [Rhipicephalus microplus]|uniref:Uncharacterized protein n=1 Tax=Rhipicephalus microplus TaxID=6941 RepID=A0A9J6EUX4_RHIMP|nr:hypothetical protein HPB51_020678 [Rhipicephalus microplus]